MSGVKGRSGTNKGKDKLWSDALRLALNERDENGEKWLRAVARACVTAAVCRDVSAIKEIGDRLDGKPAQVIAGDPDQPIIQRIENVIIDPQDKRSWGVQAAAGPGAVQGCLRRARLRQEPLLRRAGCCQVHSRAAA